MAQPSPQREWRTAARRVLGESGAPRTDWRAEASALLATHEPDPVDERSTFARAIDVATTPLTQRPAEIADTVADAIDTPREGRGLWRSRAEGFLAGAVQGAGRLVTQLTSPLDLGLTIATLGSGAAAKAGATGVRSAFRAAEAAGGGALAARGAERAVTGDSLADRAAGVLEMAGGGMAMAPMPLPPRRASTGPGAGRAAADAGAIAGEGPTPSGQLPNLKELQRDRSLRQLTDGTTAGQSTAAAPTPPVPAGDDPAYRALADRLRADPAAAPANRHDLYAWLAQARAQHGREPWFRDALRVVADPNTPPDVLADLAQRHGVVGRAAREGSPPPAAVQTTIGAPGGGEGNGVTDTPPAPVRAGLPDTPTRDGAPMQGEPASTLPMGLRSEHAGERGALSLTGNATPVVTAADVRSPNAAIEARFDLPSLPATVRARVQRAWHGVKDAAGRAVRFEYDLKKAGLTEGVDRLDQFARDRADAPRRILGRLEGVLEGLQRPAQYHAFQRVVMLRRDLELAGAMEAGRIPRRPLESGLTPADAEAELARLVDVAAREPEILAAADRHRELVRAIGDDLVDRGLMQAETRDRNAEYFPALVWDRIAQEANLAGRPVSPLTPGARGFLKQAKGGARRTVRDYVEAMSRHLAEVSHATMRDDLVKDLATHYDRTAALARGEVMPDQHGIWTYAGQSYLLPDALRGRLQRFTRAKSPEVRAMNQATAWWKRATLRVLGVPYEVLNFTGDLVNFLASEPLTELPKVPGRLGRAARATRLASDPPGTPSTHQAQLLAIAQMGEELNLGTGGATAEIGRAVAQRPALRELVRPLEDESVGRRLQRLPGDLYRRAAAAEDRFREFRENVPRLAKFMAEIERGQTPEVAARITRKELIDYTRVTDFERTWLRGALMPFVTWFKKNFENWMPGLREGADGTRTQGAIEAAQRAGKVLLPAYAVALYNEQFFPEVERNLSEIDRYRFHVLMPWNDGTLYVGLTGPANAAASFVGLQGFTQRSLDVARGRSSMGEEIARSGRQTRQSILGLLSPLATEPVEQVMNRDLRSGREIVPARPMKSTPEALGLRLKHAAERFAPVAQVIRASDDTTGAQESAQELARRLIFGNLVKPVDEERNRLLALSRAVRTGERRAEGAREAAKHAPLERLGTRFRTWGPDETDRQLRTLWPELKDDEQAFVVRALRELADDDRRFLAAATRWRLAHGSVSESEAPFVAGELRRKGFAPARR